MLEYQNFRLYIRDYYLERKERSGFTWRDFAKAAGYSSPVFLKLVADGNANLSEVGVERVASAMGLVGLNLQYFRDLVRFNQEKDSSVKKALFKNMRQLANEGSFEIVGEDQYDYYESWTNAVVRELATQMPGATPAQMADEIAFETKAADVRKALALLQKVGLLQKNEDGTFVQGKKAITTGSLDVTCLAVRETHRQMGELAVRSLDEVPVNDRDISGMTLGISETAFQKIKAEIAEFRRRVAAITLEDQGEERVYRMNVQLFPLTKEHKKGGPHA